MSLPAQGGILSYAVQPAKIGEGGVFDHTTLAWFKVRAPQVSVGAQQDQQIFPMETGGPLTPSGAFKQAKFFAGQADLIPRLENSFGWLLLGALGKASSVTGKNADGVTTTGVNTHIFSYDTALPSYQPWMAVRRMVPGLTSPENLGEIGYDCKIATLRFIVPAMGKVASQFTMIGRDFQQDDASDWVYENATFEDSSSTPDSGRGQFAFGGNEYPVTGCTVDINNGLTTPQQEMVIGSFAPDDLVALTRNVQIRFVYKYENSELHRQVFTGAVDGTTWTSMPFITASGGGVHAVDLRFQSPATIPGSSSVPYGIRIRANNATLATEGGIQLQAGGIISQMFVLTILEPSAGNYVEVVIENAETNYVLA